MKKILYFILCIIFTVGIISGCAPSTDTTVNTDTPQKLNPALEDKKEEIKKDVSLYFTSDNITTLTAEKRAVTSASVDIYKKAMEELIKGPSSKDLYATVHPETKINSVSLSGKTAVADFSDSLITYNTGGSTREYLCLYSIVNTLCSFDEIDEVIITIDGKSISTFGQFDMTAPHTMD